MCQVEHYAVFPHYLPVTGDDTYGRKVIVFSACNLPPREELDHQKLLRFSLISATSLLVAFHLNGMF